MSGSTPIICANDTPDSGAARRIAAAIGPFVGRLKLGLEFVTANGREAVRLVAGAASLFLDLKLHDIPNTVAGAVRAAAPLEPALLTVHCAGGTAMMKAAAEAAASGAGRMTIIGVTVLTSLNDDDLASVGQNGPALDQVRRLAALARDAGLDGVVCSPHEVAALRRECGSDFLLVVPGIRPAGVVPAGAAPQDDPKPGAPPSPWPGGRGGGGRSTAAPPRPGDEGAAGPPPGGSRRRACLPRRRRPPALRCPSAAPSRRAAGRQRPRLRLAADRRARVEPAVDAVRRSDRDQPGPRGAPHRRPGRRRVVRGRARPRG